MSVYVDELRVWPHAQHRVFQGGSCHLSADTLDELHAFAARIGMRRAWFQAHAVLPHYDLSPSRRAAAVAAGAVETTARERVRAARAKKRSEGGSDG